MKGYFNDESLLIYSEMVAEKIGVDFSENETYDFTRCMRSNGTYYGTNGRCREGTEAEAKNKELAGKPEGAAATSKPPVTSAAAKVARPVNSEVALQVDRAMARKNGDVEAEKRADKALKELRKANRELAKPKPPEPKAKPQETEAKPPEPKAKPPEPKVKPGQMETIERVPSRVTDEKLEASFNRSVAKVRELENQWAELRKQGLPYNDPQMTTITRKIAKAEAAATVAREAYHAIDRDRFLRAAGEDMKAQREVQKAMDEVSSKQKNAFDRPEELQAAYDKQKAVVEARRSLTEAKAAAYFGEPATTKMVSDGGGKVSSDLPASQPRGGADPNLKEFLDGSQIVMQRSPRGLSRLVESGEVLNAFQVGRSGIGGSSKSYMENRIKAEAKALGIPQNANPDQRPLYAALDNPERSRSLGGTGTMTQYGGVSLILRPSVKDRSSFTIGDSLDDAAPREMKASPIRDPAPPKGEMTSLNRATTESKITGNGSNSNNYQLVSRDRYGDSSSHTPPYIESQIYGGLKTSDIQEVRVYQGHNVAAKTVRALQEQGIRVVQLPPQMSNIDLSRHHDNFGDIRAIDTKS